jgi:hypothetical protein
MQLRASAALGIGIGLICTVEPAWLGLPQAARAHDWYPLECCSDRDCAPADTVLRREDGSFLVTARGMSVVIPADYQRWRNSPDGRIHVCIRKLRSGSEYLVCAFRSPGA